MATAKDWNEFNNVEGQSLVGGVGQVRALESGEHGTLYEIAYPQGVASPIHHYEHDSFIYLLEGHVTGTIDGETVELRAGESAVHPQGVPHSVEALVASRWLECKSPPAVGWR